MPQNITILGLGWLGLPLAQSLLKKNYTITGSTTSSQKLMGLLKSNLSVRIIEVKNDTVKGDFKKFISSSDCLIINIPPTRNSNVEFEYPAKINQIVKRCDKNMKVIFVSSTSVYGNPQSNVSEATSPVPERASAVGVLAAEKIVIDHFDKNVTVVRFAGLIGPERHPGRFLKANQPLKNPNGPINMIHQEDCIALISKIITENCFGEIINGCADLHPIRSEFYAKAAYELSLPQPIYNKDEVAVGKTVHNQKSKDLLGITYKYANPAMMFA